MTDQTLSVAADSMPQLVTLMGIIEERAAQDAKWGLQNHSFPEWLVILQEELGEACKEFFDMKYKPQPGGAERFKTELIQTAAVITAMLECGYRNNWFEGD